MKHSLLNLVSQTIAFLLVFITGIVLARYLGPTGKGNYHSLLLLIKVVAPIMMFGIPTGIQYFVANKQFKVEDVCLTVFITGLLQGIGITLIIFLLWQLSWLGQIGNRFTWIQMIVLFITCPSQVLVTCLLSLLKGGANFISLNVVLLFRTTLSITLLLVFVAVLDQGVYGACYALATETVATLLLTLILIWWRYAPKIRWGIGFFTDSLRYGLKAWIGALSSISNDRLDQVVLGAACTPEALGLYSVAASMTSVLTLIPNGIAPVFFAKSAGMKDVKEQSDLLARTHRVVLAISIIGAIGLAIGAVFLIGPVFGDEFIPALGPFLILLPGFLLFAVTRRFASRLFDAQGRPQLSSITQVVGAVVGVVFYVILVPYFGIIGAAAGSTIAYSLSAVVAIVYVKRHSLCSMKSFFVINRDDIQFMRQRFGTMFTRKRRVEPNQ